MADVHHSERVASRTSRVAAAVLIGIVATASAAMALGDEAGPPPAPLTLAAERTVVSAPRATTPASTVNQTELSPVSGPDDVLPTDNAVPDTGGLTDLIERYFGAATIEALVIVQCESHFDPEAINLNTDGTEDHGLFQINDVHEGAFTIITGRSWDDRYDAEANTAFAHWLFERAGWEPWRCNVRLDPDQQL